MEREKGRDAMNTSIYQNIATRTAGRHLYRCGGAGADREIHLYQAVHGDTDHSQY